MSIYRISSNTIPENGLFHTINREYQMNKVENQLSTGKKYRIPRENPVEVTQAMTLHSKLTKINQYLRNIQDAEGELSLVENKISDTINLLQRIRELAVQGSNGIYSKEDRRAMAMEIDQLMKNIILNANSKYKDTFLFSGFQKFTQPFEVVEGAVRGIDEAMIIQVRYLGDNGRQLREVDTGEYVSVTASGSEIFWADQFQIYSPVNTANFRLTTDTSIEIDKYRIDFNAGDNIYAIVEKINRAPVAVRASIDMITGGLILKSTVPHKIELADIEGGTLLQDLGILERGRPIGPDNYNRDATIFSGSLFDVIIGLRDAFLTNNSEDIGGRFLGAIDYSLNNLLHHTANVGALSQRLTALTDRHTMDKESYVSTLATLEDVDITESITQLRMLDFAHRVALAGIARTSQITLMDFLK